MAVTTASSGWNRISPSASPPDAARCLSASPRPGLGGTRRNGAADRAALRPGSTASACCRAPSIQPRWPTVPARAPRSLRTPEGLLELGQDSGVAGQRRRALASLLAQNAAHRITRQLQKPADLAQALALRPEKLYAVADLDRDHVGSTA